ncbi:MAG: calcium/sodium antiporter [Bacteroidetes bacterium]|nr:calcium/sodium antiporter [Bacteroidota bacterium]
MVGLFVLILGGDFLVRGASKIALRIHISPLVVGLTIVAFGTSAPELLISVNAALNGSPDIAMGNVIGSNICNLALVLGITAILSDMKVQQTSIKVDWPMAMGSSLLLYFLLFDHTLRWIEGAVFITILVIYIILIIKKSRKETKMIRDVEKEMDKSSLPSSNLRKDILFIIAGCAGLYFGAEWFVGAAQELASALGISDRVIGLTVVALGTSLPELVTAIVASLKKETDLALGNLMGSNIFNILSILGITSLITDVHVSEEILNIDMLWMLGLTFAIMPLMVTKGKIERIEGVLLLAVYIIYISLTIM